MSKAARYAPEPYGIGSRIWELFEYVRYPYFILVPDNDNDDKGDFDWFREWIRLEERGGEAREESVTSC